MVFLLERLCTLATLAGRLEQCMTARRNCFCAKPMDFALTFFFFSSPPPSWKNYSSYELPALGSGPPRFTDGTKLSWVRGPIWKFSSPGCAWLGANNSPSHLRTGEDYFPPPTITLSISYSRIWTCSQLRFLRPTGKKVQEKKLEDSSPGLFRNKEYFPLAIKRAFVLLWVGWMTVHPQLQLL